MIDLWRPEGWNNPYKNTMAGDEWSAYEDGAGAMLEALWKLARESPTGTFTIDSRATYIYGGAG